jgi:sterol desaturase/sphingolipid hydroxylase (fatty acid hydroxylase superfamily)
MYLPAAIAGIAGVLSWTFLEYVLHRFLGHDKRTQPNFFSREHTRHHSEGNYFAPAWKKGAAALVTTAVVAPIAILLGGVAVGGTYTAGLMLMYLSYEWVHWRCHVHPGIGAYGRFIRRHHFSHHFTDPKKNHGVTTPIWDFVFGTFSPTGSPTDSPTGSRTGAPAGRIRVPRRLAMVWLVDPATGDVRERFSGAYELVGPEVRAPQAV